MGTTRARKTTITPAERKRRAAAAAKAKAAKASGASAAPPDDVPEDQVKLEHGIIIWRVPMPDGVNYGTHVVGVGDVKPTEHGDLLALALRNHRKTTDPE